MKNSKNISLACSLIALGCLSISTANCENIDNKFKPSEVKASMNIDKLTSCREHYGFDCNAGPDIDKSVICKDGFKNSTQAYNKECSNYKPIKIVSISSKLTNNTYAILLKNNTTRERSQINLSFKGSGNLIIEGPKVIKAKEAAMYKIQLIVDANSKLEAKDLFLSYQ